MKQPELGRKITELRKGKGLTQEELVDKCNINVRTLQRIEAGEVTPRSYTVKTILAALDYDLSKISDTDGDRRSFSEWLKETFLIDIDPNRSGTFLIKQLNTAWLFGLVYFILGFPEAAAEYFRMEEGRMIFSIPVYISIKVAVLISFFYFQRGFILVGHMFRNYLLKIMSFVLIFLVFLIITYDIASLFYDSVEREFILGAQALTFGGIGILYGISLITLQRTTGQVPVVAGIFEIAAACFFLTIILAFVGHILLIPAELLEIVILYK
ncbi:MAG: helix-turn-helix transcriptional regulator, partial [Bacteroidales bacterium]|nr:helix-turn-helix transcriptional regulator [Bacteroidales bacterium]